MKNKTEKERNKKPPNFLLEEEIYVLSYGYMTIDSYAYFAYVLNKILLQYEIYLAMYEYSCSVCLSEFRNTSLK